MTNELVDLVQDIGADVTNIEDYVTSEEWTEAYKVAQEVLRQTHQLMDILNEKGA